MTDDRLVVIEIRMQNGLEDYRLTEPLLEGWEEQTIEIAKEAARVLNGWIEKCDQG